MQAAQIPSGRMLAGVSTRKSRSWASRSARTSSRKRARRAKSTVSELFIERTRTALGELMGRRLDDTRLAVMMLDGLEIADRTHVVALGISTEGVKIPLGLWEGSTENATLVSMLLADLVDRGLDPEQAILFVIDGGKALRKAIQDVFGQHALVHRCHRHKERNVTDLLPSAIVRDLGVGKRRPELPFKNQMPRIADRAYDVRTSLLPGVNDFGPIHEPVRHRDAALSQPATHGIPGDRGHSKNMTQRSSRQSLRLIDEAQRHLSQQGSSRLRHLVTVLRATAETRPELRLLGYR